MPNPYRGLPSVDSLLRHETVSALAGQVSEDQLTACVRAVIESARDRRTPHEVRSHPREHRRPGRGHDDPSRRKGGRSRRRVGLDLRARDRAGRVRVEVSLRRERQDGGGAGDELHRPAAGAHRDRGEHEDDSSRHRRQHPAAGEPALPGEASGQPRPDLRRPLHARPGHRLAARGVRRPRRTLRAPWCAFRRLRPGPAQGVVRRGRRAPE